MNRLHEHEFELEGELEGELHEDREFAYEGEDEAADRWAPSGELEVLSEEEGALPGLGELGGLGEGEEEWELQHEGKLLDGAFGEGELHELEGIHELHELEGEEFFRKAFRSIKRAVRVASPILKRLAATAAPLVGTAVLGPLGGQLGRMVAGALGEGELELEGEGALEGEGEIQAALAAPVAHHEALAELLGEVAAQAQTEAEAEAMAGALAALSLSRPNRAALNQFLPFAARGAGALTRYLRRRPRTRVFARMVPFIVNTSIRGLVQRSGRGEPITRRTLAHLMARNTRRLLASPSLCNAALRRNVRAARSAARVARIRPVRG